MKKNKNKLSKEKKEKILKFVNVVSYVLNGIFLLFVILGLIGMNMPKKQSETSAISEPLKHNQINPPQENEYGYYDLEDGYYVFDWASWSQGSYSQQNPNWFIEISGDAILIPRFYVTAGDYYSGVGYTDLMMIYSSYVDAVDFLNDEDLGFYDDFSQITFYVKNCLIRVPTYSVFSYFTKVPNLTINGYRILLNENFDPIWIDQKFNINFAVGGTKNMPYVEYTDDQSFSTNVNTDYLVDYSVYRGLFWCNGELYREIIARYICTYKPRYYDYTGFFQNPTLSKRVLQFDCLYYLDLNGNEVIVNSAYYKGSPFLDGLVFYSKDYGYTSIWSTSHYSLSSASADAVLRYQLYGYIDLYNYEERYINYYTQYVDHSIIGSYSNLPLDYSYLSIMARISDLDLYDEGADLSAIGNMFVLFKTLFNSLSGFLGIELFAGVTISTLLFLPFFVGLMLFIINLFKR